MKKRQGSAKSKRSTRRGRLSPALRDNARSASQKEDKTPQAPAFWPEEEGELPDFYEETKVVLLPVNPYLAHVYWGIAPTDHKEIERVFAKLDRQAQPVLRFYDVTDVNFEGIDAQSWFDVEIDLRAGNWYVHLQRPARSYCIDLGLRIKGEGFRRLARSNVAEMPRAWPSEKIEEGFLPGEADHARGQTIVPPVIDAAAAAKIPPELSPDGAPQRPDDKGPEPKELRIFRAATPGEMEGKVAEVYQQRMREWSGAAPEGRHTGKSPCPGEELADLTQLSERSFRTGTSAGRMTSVESHTEKRER